MTESAWKKAAVKAALYVGTLEEIRKAQDAAIDLLDAGKKVPGPAAWKLVVLDRRATLERDVWQAAVRQAEAAEKE